MASDALSERAIKKVTNLIRDARLAVVVGLIPILGLIYILRLVQWYLLRKDHPLLATEDSEVATEFRASLHRLWFAVLFWPGVILFVVVCILVT